MGETAPKGQFATLHEALQAGRISRRQFTLRALALGVGMPVISFVLRADGVRASGAETHLGWGVAAAQGASARPTEGMDGRKRGEGGELKLLQWQAATVLSPHVAQGTKDYLAASITLEPLMNYLPDGTLLPNLIKEVPTVENGGLAKDLTSVTYKLLEGVKWSDGEPFTADDVVFTWQWVIDPANTATSAGVYASIKSIEAVDATTAKVTFSQPLATWFEPHAGTVWGYVYPKHVLSAGKDANDKFMNSPVTTGPYVVDQFSPNDTVGYKINDNYRDPNKPYFATINLKGGGDSVSAARAVLQTGDYDYAWNLQVEPQILDELAKGGKGKVVTARGTSVERLMLNFSDPNKEVDGQRSEMHTPHPYFSHKEVRQALNLSADREMISKQFYSPEEPPTANILTGIAPMESKNTSWAFDVEKGKQILEDAGWKMNGDVREKDGVQLNLVYATTINPVRQKTQAVLKKALEQMGFKVQLQQIDSGIFFDTAPGNEQNFGHMYYDMNMYTNNSTTPIPVAYMIGWYAGPEGENIAQKSNGWNGQNAQRYNNPEYDKLFDQVRLETDFQKAAQLFIQLNDILINDVAVVPLVNRAADKYATANSLVDANVAVSDFEVDYWNIANWNRTP